jgi:hypothetical protein
MYQFVIRGLLVAEDDDAALALLDGLVSLVERAEVEFASNVEATASPVRELRVVGELAEVVPQPLNPRDE